MTESWYYNPGDHYVLDDLTGFKRRASKCRMIEGGQTGGAFVDAIRWEAQQPQDFVRGVVDDQTVDNVRGRQPNQFMVVGTFVVSPAARGAQSIQVDSSVGMSVGDSVQIMLDSGENFTTTLASISGPTLGLAAPLPHGVGFLGDPIENVVLDLTAPTAPLNLPVL